MEMVFRRRLKINPNSICKHFILSDIIGSLLQGSIVKTKLFSFLSIFKNQKLITLKMLFNVNELLIRNFILNQFCMIERDTNCTFLASVFF